MRIVAKSCWGQKALQLWMDGRMDGGVRTQLSCRHRRRTNAFTKEVHRQGHRVRAWNVHKSKDTVTYHFQINQRKSLRSPGCLKREECDKIALCLFYIKIQLNEVTAKRPAAGKNLEAAGHSDDGTRSPLEGTPLSLENTAHFRLENKEK